MGSFVPEPKKSAGMVAATGGDQMFSADNLVMFKCKIASQVAAALKVLEQRELVSKNGNYQVYDPVFRKWLRQLI